MSHLLCVLFSNELNGTPTHSLVFLFSGASSQYCPLSVITRFIYLASVFTLLSCGQKIRHCTNMKGEPLTFLLKPRTVMFLFSYISDVFSYEPLMLVSPYNKYHQFCTWFCKIVPHRQSKSLLVYWDNEMHYLLTLLAIYFAGHPNKLYDFNNLFT